MTAKGPHAGITQTKEAKAEKRQSAAGPSSGGFPSGPSADYTRGLPVTRQIFHEGLLWLASQNQRNTNLVLQELRTMASNDAALTQVVNELLDAYQDLTGAISAEVTALQAKGLQADPVVSASINQIQNVIAKMKQLASDARQAVVPSMTTDTPDPSDPAASTGLVSGSADAAAASTSAAAAATADVTGAAPSPIAEASVNGSKDTVGEVAAQTTAAATTDAPASGTAETLTAAS